MILLKFLASLLLGLALVSRGLATTGGAEPSTVLNPTPAAETSEAEEPCQFSDVQQLDDHLNTFSTKAKNSNPQRDRINFLVQECNDICVLVYGTGNPDLSGIGVRQTYQSQLYKILTHLHRLWYPTSFREL